MYDPDMRTDLRAVEGHEGWRSTYRLCTCDPYAHEEVAP
jgi:hypothetical protein